MLILPVSMGNFCPIYYKSSKVKNLVRKLKQQYVLNSTQTVLEIKLVA